MKRPRGPAIVLSLPLVLLLFGTAAAAPESPPVAEKFRAFAASLGTGASAVVEIGISRWTTDEEREKLLTALQEKGPDELLSQLTKMPPVGYIRRTGSLSWDLYYARQRQLGNGSRQIVLATNRPIRFREVVSGRRSRDYQLTVVELRTDASGKGEGKLVPKARVTWDRDARAIQIENYDALPVELLSVTSEKP